MNNPIPTDEMKGLITLNPGISGKQIIAHFGCERTKVKRCLTKLRNEDFFFDQDVGNEKHYFEYGYAERNNIPKRIFVGISRVVANAGKRAKRKEVIRKKRRAMSMREEMLFVNNYWRVPSSNLLTST